jgi:regulator of cell morphogenesis and NO signaling
MFVKGVLNMIHIIGFSIAAKYLYEKRMMSPYLLDIPIRNLVIEHPEVMAVLEKFNIDYYCNTLRTVRSVCEEKDLVPDKIDMELEALCFQTTSKKGIVHFEYWKAADIMKYIKDRHHTYFHETFPEVCADLIAVSEIYGGNFPELNKVKKLLFWIIHEMQAHIYEEWTVVFPFINILENNNPLPKKYKSVRGHLSELKINAEDILYMFDEIRRITHNYATSDCQCNVMIETYLLLEEIERNLHLYFHLENNILFPMATRLEIERKPPKK